MCACIYMGEHIFMNGTANSTEHTEYTEGGISISTYTHRQIQTSSHLSKLTAHSLNSFIYQSTTRLLIYMCAWAIESHALSVQKPFKVNCLHAAYKVIAKGIERFFKMK